MKLARSLLALMVFTLLFTPPSSTPQAVAAEAREPLKVCNWHPEGEMTITADSGRIKLPMRVCPGTELRIQWEVIE